MVVRLMGLRLACLCTLWAVSACAGHDALDRAERPDEPGGMSLVPPAAPRDAGVLAPAKVERAKDAGAEPVDAAPSAPTVQPPSVPAADGGMPTAACSDHKGAGCTDGGDAPQCESRSYYADLDQDGAGDPHSIRHACSLPQGYSANADDCDDDNPQIGPGRQERCDGKDDDCDGRIDEAASGEPSCAGARFACRGAQGWSIIDCGGDALDCDGSSSNCCEVPVGLTDCGACGNACGFACVAGSCDEVAQLGLGAEHSCAITSTGTLACWGHNAQGQLGMGDVQDRMRPTRVELPTPVYAVSGGAEHTCAIAGAERQLFCWGSNSDGQSGFVSEASEQGVLLPHAVQAADGGDALLHVQQVSAGERHTCAVLQSGELYCWGQQANGRLGNRISIAGGSNLPHPVYRESEPVIDAIQVVSGSAHACALLRDHTVMCWGSNGEGELGDGSQEGESASALVVPGLADIEALAAGPQHTCAISAGQVLCWGSNKMGELGREDAATDVPAPVANLHDTRAITAANGFSCALDIYGTATCWGSSAAGERGDENMESSAAPSTVQLPGILDLAAGNEHVCARTEHTAYCWGKSSYGQLGYDAGTSAFSASAHAIEPLL